MVPLTIFNYFSSQKVRPIYHCQLLLVISLK